MGYTEKERVQVKIEFLRMIARMEINHAKMELIYGFIRNVSKIKLTETEEKQMRGEIKKLPDEEADRVLELPNSYRDAGREEGIVIEIEVRDTSLPTYF